MELEDRLKEFAGAVAKIVRRAPQFEDWPIVEAPGLALAKIELAKL